ncbi:MAG TPA: 3-dehydroquinate synthase, partial [Firmicutes bacterium]|nr:3-dehydroquinate synthase [Bacillota bacterium]
GKKVALVTDDSVGPLYTHRLIHSLETAGYTVLSVTLPAGEKHKQLGTVERIIDACLEVRFDRNSAIIALGGGVVGDMAGFAAAVLLRGIRFVQVPTTIVAQVDASVGGKTGVDHLRGKNLIGAFHQPSLVYIDVETLSTLPERERIAGLAEVLKHAIIRDAELFRLLESSVDRFADFDATPEEWVALIERNCAIKADIVGQDERESGIRALLNYGHTTGHAIETLGDYDRYRHGEAVLLGMLIAGEIASGRNLLTEPDHKRHNALINRILRVPIPTDYSSSDVWECMLSDKKIRDGVLAFILPTRIGDVTIVRDVKRAEFEAAWDRAITQ